MALLVKGNSKLGKSIYQFSIPAGSTCPGRSNLCNSRCYAQKGMFTMPSVKTALQRREAETKEKDFVDRMIYEITKRKVEVLRVHCAGDFYSAEYVSKWYKIISSCLTTVFFTYTRSWRIKEINKELVKLVKLKNLRLWYSIDRETGIPKHIPKNVRLAYMAVSLDDVPSVKAKIVFRDYNVRNVTQKRINGVFVCPPENGTNIKLNCEKCKVCWRQQDVPGFISSKSVIGLSLV